MFDESGCRLHLAQAQAQYRCSWCTLTRCSEYFDVRRWKLVQEFRPGSIPKKEDVFNPASFEYC